MPFDVVTLGEAMIRLSPPGFRRLEQAEGFDAQVGGGELNVAVSAARLGLSAAWVSRLTSNPLGRMVANRARLHGVDVSHVVWTDQDRVGLYFTEFGAAPRASLVVYDRAGSAVSKLGPGMVDWPSVLAGCRWFHTSGITPALSPSCAEVTREAMQAAKAAGARTSFDVNYRKKLWTPEQAGRVCTELMAWTDVLITTEEDTAVVFGIKGEDYAATARQLADRFGFQAVAITIRVNPLVWQNTWTALAYAGGTLYETKTYTVEIVDRVGAGDSFSGGFIYGLLARDGDVQYALDFGVANSALKHSIPGDLNWTTKDEVEALMKGGGMRIQR